MALVGLKVFPIVIIGGLDSIAGTLVGATLVGVLESVTAGYVDPLVGGGFGNVASCLALIAMLFVRPHGLFGRATVERARAGRASEPAAHARAAGASPLARMCGRRGSRP